jgi:hypothetical protein
MKSCETPALAVCFHNHIHLLCSLG